LGKRSNKERMWIKLTLSRIKGKVKRKREVERGVVTEEEREGGLHLATMEVRNKRSCTSSKTFGNLLTVP